MRNIHDSCCRRYVTITKRKYLLCCMYTTCINIPLIVQYITRSILLARNVAFFSSLFLIQMEGPTPYRAGFIVTKTSTESSAQEELEVTVCFIFLFRENRFFFFLAFFTFCSTLCPTFFSTFFPTFSPFFSTFFFS